MSLPVMFIILFTTNTIAWSLYFIIKTNQEIAKKISKFMGHKDGSYFCHSCHSYIGHRKDGEEFINGMFVEKKIEETIPTNVVSFRNKD